MSKLTIPPCPYLVKYMRDGKQLGFIGAFPTEEDAKDEVKKTNERTWETKTTAEYLGHEDDPKVIEALKKQ